MTDQTTEPSNIIGIAVAVEDTRTGVVLQHHVVRGYTVDFTTGKTTIQLASYVSHDAWAAGKGAVSGVAVRDRAGAPEGDEAARVQWCYAQVLAAAATDKLLGGAVAVRAPTADAGEVA